MDDPDIAPGESSSCAGAGSKPFQRFEVYTGAGRRRSFTIEEKLALVAQMAGCENISDLARRHHLRPSQLFTWRRELRYAAESAARDTEPVFVPAIIAHDPQPSPVKASKARRRRSAPAIEMEIDGVAVKIGRGADATLIAAVIEALKSRLALPRTFGCWWQPVPWISVRARTRWQRWSQPSSAAIRSRA